MFRYFLSFLSSHHRTLHSSIQPTLCSSICSYVRLSMEGKLTSRICRRKFWHASISPTLTWEMRLAIRWNPFLLRNQRTNFGIGKYCFWIRQKKVIYYLEEIKRELSRERQDLISEIRRNDKRSSVKTIQRDPSEIDEGWNDEDNFFLGYILIWYQVNFNSRFSYLKSQSLDLSDKNSHSHCHDEGCRSSMMSMDIV